MTKEDKVLISEIAKRSEEMSIGNGNRLTRMLDLEVAHEQFNLRLEDFANAKAIDFIHDFCGIQGHVDRKNKEWVDDCFLPRFA